MKAALMADCSVAVKAEKLAVMKVVLMVDC
jgi:hypothetical protein